jgi:hypothetical protein
MEPGKSVWLRTYSVYLAESLVGRTGTPILRDLGGTRICIFSGILPDLPQATFHVKPWSGGSVEFEPRVEPLSVDARTGTWATLFVADPGTDEIEARALLDATVTIVRLVLGRNAAFAPVGEPIRIISGRDFQIPSAGIENPSYFPPPDLTLARLDFAAKIAAATQDPSPDGRRLSLALRWAGRASELSGVDAFLSWWIAIETIAMPDTTNVSPLIEKISALYGIDPMQGRERFHIGRFSGLRGRIVHGGHVRPLDHRLVDFLAALFADLIGGRAGVPTSAVGQCLAEGWDLAALLRETE